MLWVGLNWEYIERVCIEVVLLENGSHVVKGREDEVLNELREAKDDSDDMALLDWDLNWLI
jgi:ABC-type polysaccharide/polyol phosphate transport system ATPase subunit